MGGVQWKNESECSVSSWFNCCVWFCSSLIWRRCFQRRAGKQLLSALVIFEFNTIKFVLWLLIFSLLHLLGWTLENVGRLLGIFYGTSLGSYISKPKERDWWTHSEEGTWEIHIFSLCRLCLLTVVKQLFFKPTSTSIKLCLMLVYFSVCAIVACGSS